MSSIPIPGNPFEIYTYTIGTAPDNIVQRKALRYNSADVYLGGVYAPTAQLDGDFDLMMKFLSENENNFFRHWMVNYFLLDPNQSRPGTPPEPFRKRYCPYAYDIGARKWNLLAYNDAEGDPQSYFARLRRMIEAARKYNIIVQLTIFDACGMRPGDPNDPEDNKKRWPWSPWNDANNKQTFITHDSTAFPTFYKTETIADIRQAQHNYVRRVVERTVEYWNVVYEIMNEPGGLEDNNNLTLRAKWADQMVEVINNITKGRRLIFFNDFHNGKDVNHWKALNLPNYEALDGVIFHGNPNLVDPDTNAGWHFRGDKVIQASSDGYGAPRNDPDRDKRLWNRTTTDYLFNKKIIFQAETGGSEPAIGIQRAVKGPTVIKRPPFIGDWDKIPGAWGPDFFLQFNANGKYCTVDTPNDVVTSRGRLIGFTDDRFVVKPDGKPQVEYAYTLSGDTLSYHPVTDATRLQTFKRFSGPVEPFIYWWEKVSHTPGSTRPLFNLFFRPDGTFAARALGTMNLMGLGSVKSVLDDLGKVVFHNNNTGLDETWSYRFYNTGQSLRLTNASGDYYAIYERRA